MFSKITKLNDYDKVTLIYEPTVQAKEQKSQVLTYLFVLAAIAIFLLGVNFAFHFIRFTHLRPPPPAKYQLDDQDRYWSTNHSPIDHHCPRVKFDYLLLSIQWPPSVCNYDQCRKGVRMYDWHIHGLWPDYKNGTYPSFCCENYKFDIEQLKSILSQVEYNWQDLLTENEQNGLWEHEWQKHGTCAIANAKLGTLFNYFNATLTLFNKYKIQQWLEEDNILPTSTKPYKLASILNTIESRLGGKRIKVECDKYVHTKENCDHADYSEGRPKNCTQIASKAYKLLDSIDICFDKDTLLPIDCPMDRNKFRKNTCDKDVYYFRLKEDLDTLKF